MITLCVRGLSRSTTEEQLTELFSVHGNVRNMKFVRDLFSGECKGFATLQMEGHEARAAISALDSSSFQGGLLRVDRDRPRPGRGGKRRR